MTVSFERPIGAQCDLNELKYISALHQTVVRPLRLSGSIHANDIVNLLSSRHGIKVDQDTIKNKVLVGLTGDLEIDPNKHLDLCNVVGLLLIPHLAKVAASGDAKAIRALFGKVLATIKNDVIGDDKSDAELLYLDRDLMHRILERYGEADVSDGIIDEMLEAAGGPIYLNATLNVDTFMHALTSDVTKYDTKWDTTISTHYQDVFASVDEANDSDDENPAIVKNDGNGEFEDVFTAPFIDTTADTFRSQSFSVILWVALLVAYVCYFFGAGLTSSRMECGANFGCQILEAIVTWVLVFLQLSIIGSAFIFLGSMGNSLKKQKFVSIKWQIAGMIAVFLITVVPIFTIGGSPKREYLRTAYLASLALGGILLVLQFLHLMGMLYDLNHLKQYKVLDIFLTPGIRKMECKTKQAATHKVSLMVAHSLDLHNRPPSESRPVLSSQSVAFDNFQLEEGLSEEIGGFLWVWRKIIGGTLFTEEGVWLHSRVIASNAAQFLVSAFLLTMCGFGIKKAAAVQSYTIAFIQGDATMVYDWEIAVGATVGLLTGFAASLAIALVFLPSFISSVLRFRSGVIPSLQAKEFLGYRFAIDQVTVVFGSAFWGCVYSGIVMTVVVGGITFLGVWHITTKYVLIIVANIVGMLVTNLLKIAILQMLRRQFYAAFYRRLVAEANYMNVAMECWNLGLSAGFMFIRTLRLAFIAFFYLGRIDTPLLAPGVGVLGPITLDVYPVAFYKDLLVHEAHRHPYLERLCTMYMMKLRFGNEFVTRAGSVWRLLFVLVLMPWMSKYRIRHEIEVDGNKLDLHEGDTDDSDAGTWNEPPAWNLDYENKVRKNENRRTLRSMSVVVGYSKVIEDIDELEMNEHLELPTKLTRGTSEGLLSSQS